MANRDYERDRDFGNRGFGRGRSDYDRDRWYGGYDDFDRGWNRSAYGWGAGPYGPDYGYGGYYGRSAPWYGGGYGGPWYGRGYPPYTGYPGEYAGYDEGYGNNDTEWRSEAGAGLESGPMMRGLGVGRNQWRWGLMGHAGRGPRNYQRSDERIEEDVNEELTRHPGLDASDIEVKVNHGEVTLTGAVESRHAKRMAEDAAERVSGVIDVHNQLRVSPSGASRTAEREVTRPAHREGKSTTQRGETRSGARQSGSSSARSR